MFDAITIGSATVDVFATIDKKFYDVKVGDKVLITDLKFETGGGGLNAGVGLARMGLKVAFLGKLGHDLNANKIMHELRKENVFFIHTKPSEKATSYSFIETSTKQPDRIIYTHKGASDDLHYSEVPRLKTKWLYMATMLGDSFKTCEYIAGYCKKKEIHIMFNPSTYLAAQGKDYLKHILDATTILVLNRSEARLLLGTKSDHIDFLLASLHKLGPKIVIITDGPRGVHAYKGEYVYFIKPDKIKVISTTGAGDAFASGFLAGYIHHKDIAVALEFGLANAQSVIRYYGAKNRLLNYHQAIDDMHKHKRKVTERKLNLIKKRDK
jgi:ribokinase